MKLSGGAVVVLHRVSWANDLRVLKTHNGPDELILNLIGKGSRDPIHIVLPSVKSLGLQEDLVAIFLCKLDDLVFNRRAVARPCALNSPGIHRRFVQIVANHIVRPGVRVGRPARYLFHVEHIGAPMIQREQGRCLFQYTTEIAESRRRAVPGLGLHDFKIDRTPIHPTGCASLKSSDLKPEGAQTIRQRRNSITHPSALLVLKAYMKQAPHKGTGGNHDRSGIEDHSQTGPETHHPVLLNKDLRHISLMKVEVWLGFNQPFHSKLVGLLVTLRAGSLDAGALRRIEHSKLDPRGIRVQCHHSAQSINFSDKMTFRQSPNRWVAGHLGNRIQILSEDRNLRPKSCGSHGRLHTRMPSSTHHHVVAFGISVK